MIALGSANWGTQPTISLSFAYEHRRSGADMQYRVQVAVSATTGIRYFGYPIYFDLSLDGETQLSTTVKNPYPDQWSSALTYTSAWYTVKNKTAGTTAAAFRIYSGMGSSRDSTYSYQLAIDPAASTMTVSDGTLGTAQTVSVTRNNTAFTHTLTYTCGTDSGTVVSDSADTAISWTPPLSLASQNGSGVTVQVGLTLTTYSGDTVVGTDKKTVTCAIPASVVPAVSLSVSDAMGYADTYGGYVQSKSRLAVAVEAAGSYGAWITERKTAVNGAAYTGSSFTTDPVKSGGTVTVTATVKDSRGRTATAEVQLTVLPYSPPKTAIQSVRRCDAAGNYSRSGGYLRVDFTASAASLEAQNTAAFTLRTKKATESLWNSQSLPDYENLYSVPEGVAVFAADTGSSYNVELVLQDGFESSKALGNGSSVSKFMSWFRGGLGIAFGKVAEEENVLDSLWPIKARGGLQIPDHNGTLTPLRLAYPVGAIYMSVLDTSPEILFGGTWERLKDSFLLAAGDAYAPGSTGGEAAHRLTADEMPSHDHTQSLPVGSSKAAWAMKASGGSWAAAYPDNLSVSYSSSRANALNTWTAGGGASHNNMPPYLAVYMWKRTG